MEGTERGPGRLKALGICNVAFHLQDAIAQPSPAARWARICVCVCVCVLASPRLASSGSSSVQCPGSGLPYPLDCTAVPFIVLLPVLSVRDAWNSCSNWEPGLWINVIMDGMKACPIGPSVRSRLAVCIL
ncbi:hypothetical protein CCHR01_19835 [Colletotrichum chrysophilum]|uniref:Uncharacterized protein n=1 Tax=Colletotrichum chrysophilum TaxID=1836956 RepID=A0AAD9E7H5_9PEZI|nr:hypothetical protein CCHR01_19835 [Colletotrichum chrysophilum]